MNAHRSISRAAALALALASGAAAADGVGHRKHAPEPRHVQPGAADRPTVHKLFDVFQKDQKFVRLFSPTGKSEICGPASLTNVMLYLKLLHEPAFPKLLESEFQKGAVDALAARARGSQHHDERDHFDEIDVVFDLFKRCHTDRSEGTGTAQLLHCATKVIKASGYGVQDAFILGASALGRARNNPLLRAPEVEDLRKYSRSTWKKGQAASKSDRGVVLLFGWYDPKGWSRHGGHFVALAGHDANDARTVYVGNPGVNYDPANDGGNGEAVAAQLAKGKASKMVASAPGDFHSKIVFDKVPDSAPVGGEGLPFKQMVFTKDMTTNPDRVAVLEDVLVLLPR
jgi:hypothetical protein